MRPRIPGIDEDGIGPPGLYFARERWSIQPAKMIQPWTPSYIRHELIRIAVEQRDIPFHLRAKTRVEHAVGGRLRPSVKNPQINLARPCQSPEHRRVVLYWVGTDNRQFTLRHVAEVLLLSSDRFHFNSFPRNGRANNKGRTARRLQQSSCS